MSVRLEETELEVTTHIKLENNSNKTIKNSKIKEIASFGSSIKMDYEARFSSKVVKSLDQVWTLKLNSWPLSDTSTNSSKIEILDYLRNHVQNLNAEKANSNMLFLRNEFSKNFRWGYQYRKLIFMIEGKIKNEPV